MEEERTHWTLDKRIPVALLMGLAGSTLGIGATAVVAHYRLGSVERHLERIDTRYERDSEARRAIDRDAGLRDRQVSETLAELREATRTLREAVTELRSTVRNANGVVRPGG
jgi:hypothetical protein